MSTSAIRTRSPRARRTPSATTAPLPRLVTMNAPVTRRSSSERRDRISTVPSVLPSSTTTSSTSSRPASRHVSTASGRPLSSTGRRSASLKTGITRERVGRPMNVQRGYRYARARCPPAPSTMHVLVLTDRDWTHPQGGGTGTVLRAQVGRWLAWGHRVTIVASSYPGADATVTDGALTIHRGGRLRTVIPRMGWRAWRGLGAEADVVFEVVNGVFWMTPLWVRRPCVTYVQHLSRGPQYDAELGWIGRPLGLLLETLPLSLLYRRSRFLTLSTPMADALAGHGVPRANIAVRHPGLEPERLRNGREGDRADARLPRPHTALQEHRGRARRAGGRSGGAPRRGGRRRAPARAGGRDRAHGASGSA